IAGYDIDIAIRTEDLNSGLSVANKLVALIKEKVKDVSEPEIDTTEGLPQVEIVIDRERAYSFGVNISDAAKEVKASIAGSTATIFRQGGNEYDVVLMFQESDRAKIPDLEQIYVKGSSGRVALSNFEILE